MKMIKYAAITLVVVFVMLLVAPFLFKGKIVALVKEQANGQFNAKINFSDDISLSLIKNFPNLSVGINDLSVVGINDFDKDTLFAAKSISLSLDIMSVIKGEQMDVRKVSMNQPRIHAIVLSNGKANWDIAKEDTTNETPADTAASKFHVKLKKFEITEGYLSYNDQESNMNSEMVGVNYVMEGDFTDVLFELKNKMSIESLTFGMDGMNYLYHVNAKADANIDADMNNFKFVFKDNEFSLNQLVFGMDGSFAMPGDDMVMDIKYSAKQNDFKNFLSLIPAIYANDFKDLETKGKMEFNGFVKGTYNSTQMPAFALNLGVAGGWFKYPALPSPVENVSLKLAVQNPDGNLGHTEINLSALHFELQGDPFDAKLFAKNPMSNPYLDAYAKGVLNLDHIVKIVPMPAGTTLHGIIKSDFSAKGNVSTIDAGNYEAFNATGNILCENIYYASADLPKAFELSKAEMSFSPKLVQLKSFNAKMGNSDFNLSGDLANFFPYYFGKGAIKGTLNFSSQLIDANAFLAENSTTATTSTDTAAMSVFEVPQNIDFTLNSNVKKVLYTNMEISNLVGTIQVLNQQLVFKNVGLQTLGSSMQLNGYYESKNPKKPSMDIDFGINNLDIQKAFLTFNTVKKLAPAAEHVFGTFSTSLKMKTALDEHMQPNLSTLSAEGVLSIPSAEIKGIQTLNKISDLINKPEYKVLGFSNAKIAYKVENGRVYTKDFDVKVGPQTMQMSGSTGLDQSIDYIGKLNVPRKDLGAADAAISEALAQLNAAAGSSIKMNENLPVQLKIGGTFTAPVITTNLADLAKGEANSVKDQALDALKKKQQELTDKAKADLEKAKNEATAKLSAEADRLKKEAAAKASAEADRIKKEAENKVKSEAEKLKKQAAEEAKKKLKGIF